MSDEQGIFHSEEGNTKVNEKLRLKLESHLAQLTNELSNLDKNLFPMAYRLLDEELKRTQESGKPSGDHRYLDLYNEKPVNVQCRVQFPTKEHPSFNFVGKVLGPKGQTMKQLQEQSRCRMYVLGRGSMKDKAKEEELRNCGDPKYSHLFGDLHLVVSVLAAPAEAHHRMAYALQQLKELLVPDSPYDDGFGGVPPPSFRNGPPGSNVMSFLEKARQSLEFQPPMPPRRFPGPRGGGFGGRGGATDRGGRGGFRPRGGAPRKAPY